MEKEISMVLYFYLHSKVGESVLNEKKGDGIMPIKEVEWRMFQWKIPSCLKPIIIKIWEDLGIIKKIDKRNIKFIKTDFNIEDIGRLYDKLGIFKS